MEQGWGKFYFGKNFLKRESPTLKKGEVGINEEAGKNTAITIIIEIKSSNDLVKISTKRT